MFKQIVHATGLHSAHLVAGQRSRRVSNNVLFVFRMADSSHPLSYDSQQLHTDLLFHRMFHSHNDILLENNKHYKNLPMHIQRFFSAVKISLENFFYFLIFAQNIDCGYTLEPPCRGGSNGYPQSIFWIKNKNQMTIGPENAHLKPVKST